MPTQIPPADSFIGVLAQLTFIILTVTALFGVPLLVALAVRFLWYRHVYVGRSAELEKLIWQLHRIASSLEAQRTPEQAPTQQPPDAANGKVSLSMFGR